MSRTGQLPNNINPQIQSPMHAVLLWAGPNYFVPYQKLIYIVSQFETFCARPKDYFHIVTASTAFTDLYFFWLAFRFFLHFIIAFPFYDDFFAFILTVWIIFQM